MRSKVVPVTLLLVLCALLIGCANYDPAEMHYGQDQCDYCRMGIADAGYGSQLIARTGKAYKFDSIECLAAFELTQMTDPEEIGARWVANVKKPGTFLSVEKATIVHSELLRSPMGLGLAAVASPEIATEFGAAISGRVISWPAVREHVQQAWNLKP